MFYGYTDYQAARPMARAEQRQADAQLGRLWAALAQWRQTLVSPARALRPQLGTSPTSPRTCGPVDCELAVRTAP
jgi:hypothetical protein